MKNLKIAALAVLAAATLAASAEAGERKHHFYKFPIWGGPHYNNCWYQYHKVPHVYFQNVRYYENGEYRWKRIKKIRYVTKPQQFCDHYRY